MSYSIKPTSERKFPPFSRLRYLFRRSQWLRGLRRRSSAARLLRSWVRIPPGAWMFVCCECCVLSSRGLFDELITRPEKSYRLWCVVIYDLETSWMRRPWPTGGCRTKNKQKNILLQTQLWANVSVATMNSMLWTCKDPNAPHWYLVPTFHVFLNIIYTMGIFKGSTGLCLSGCHL